MTANLKALVQKWREQSETAAGNGWNEAAELHQRHADELSHEIERMESEPRAQEWRPIESAPKDGSYVLLVNMNAKPNFRCLYIGAYRFGLDREPWSPEKQWRDYAGKYATPTHWQPLPEPPP